MIIYKRCWISSVYLPGFVLFSSSGVNATVLTRAVTLNCSFNANDALSHVRAEKTCCVIEVQCLSAMDIPLGTIQENMKCNDRNAAKADE